MAEGLSLEPYPPLCYLKTKLRGQGFTLCISIYFILVLFQLGYVFPCLFHTAHCLGIFLRTRALLRLLIPPPLNLIFKNNNSIAKLYFVLISMNIFFINSYYIHHYTYYYILFYFLSFFCCFNR